MRSTVLAIGVVLLLLWVSGYVIFKVAGFLIHLLLIAGVLFLLWGLVKRVT